MQRKIKKQFILIAAITMLATMILVSWVFYGIFKKQVMDDLETYTHVVKNIDASERIHWEETDSMTDNVRITIVAADGKVLYDNYADPSTMDNHADRIEIKEALEEGEGQSVRKSDTLAVSSYYYAVKLDDGAVLRVSKEARNIAGVILNLIPIMLLIACSIVLLCVFLANIITKRLVKPIEDMAEHIGEPNQVVVYDELVPFMTTIRSQHEDILKGAKMRQEFTASVSHELKTPLTSISGYAELMENGMAQGEDIGRFSRAIHQNADRLLTLINDIIRLSELDSNNYTPTFESLDLYEVSNSCAEMLQMYAMKHEVTLSVEGSSQIINANKQMIEELVYNLTDNAIRYNNPGGKVRINIYRNKEGIVLAVKDNGIGIKKEHQQRIFERFYRVDKSRSKATGGTGLGLAIVKHIAMQHNADLQINSEEGKGTEIKVIFPF